MKIFLKTSIVFGALLILSFSANVWALPIDINNEIKIDYQAYQDSTSDRFLMHNLTTNDSYNTFCVEESVYFTWDTMYVHSVTDPNSPKTTWLYASYWDGVFGDHTEDLMMTVQKAIWYTEENNGSYQSEYNSLVKDTTNFAVSGWDIQVVKLSDGNNTFYQSQLTGLPVPEPATMVLFGIGLLGLGALGRKKRI